MSSRVRLVGEFNDLRRPCEEPQSLILVHGRATAIDRLGNDRFGPGLDQDGFDEDSVRA